MNEAASTVFSRRMREARGSLGLSIAALASRLEQLEQPIAYRTLQRIESGQRPPTIDEALAIAWALAVAPVHMLVPFEEPIGVEAGDWIVYDAPRRLHVAKDVDMHPGEARAWIAGHSIRDTGKPDYPKRLQRFRFDEAPPTARRKDQE